MREPTGEGIELRCFCSARPLLAKAGRDPETGEAWVHVKVWKGKILYAESVSTAGSVHLRCRFCYRWHTVRIVLGAPRLAED